MVPKGDSGETKERSSPGAGANPSIYVIFISLILDLLAFTVILPLLPSILEHYEQEAEGDLYHQLKASVSFFQSVLDVPDKFTSVLFGGFLGSMFCLLQFVASPLIGSLSDVYGRKPVLLATMCGICMSYIIWSLASSFALFVLSRIIGGLSKGNISLSTAIVSDLSSEETRGKGMALIGVAFSIGFIVGPLIGALFFKFGGGSFLFPALFSVTLSALNIVFIACKFPESLPAHSRCQSVMGSMKEAVEMVSPASLFAFRPVKRLKDRDRDMLVTLGRGYFWYLFVYSGLEFSLTFLVHLRFQFTSVDQGKMFCFIGIVMALLQGGYVRRISPGKEIPLVVRALMVLAPSFVIIAFAHSIVVLYGGLLLFAYGSAVIVPCLTTAVSRIGGPDEKGAIMGTFRSLGALARGLGPFVACSLYWCVGPKLCYLLGGMAMILPYLLIKKLK
ncbi:unnamed protein product [Cyprideis torosa]|uniref:Uncharacterized protein n=1 Tax=Cyprideis torosa TaxID=163714 RepID=A0A7R8WEV0_9CRUS|nr:unnamed protein product [Cyprideis torosa]CAG0890221.1 unnamed protein product [Cyprideis torosa]